MFTQKKTKIALKRTISFFIGLSLLSANYLNPLNSKVSAMKKNKETKTTNNENKSLTLPNENQIPLNEGSNGNGIQGDLQNTNSQSLNEVINVDSHSSETNSEEDQSSTNSNQTNLQNTNSLMPATDESYLNSGILHIFDENSEDKKENTPKTNENANEFSVVETADNGRIITTNGESLKFEDVFYFFTNKKNNTSFAEKSRKNYKYLKQMKTFDFHMSEKDSMVSIIEVKKEYKKTIKEVFLPKFLNINNQKMPVIAIGESAFSECSELTKIVVSDCVLKIGSLAFMCCKKLTTVVLPESIQFINSRAFWNCSNLTSINLPNSILNIDSSTFANCIKLETIVLPNFTNLNDYMFIGCENLTTVVLPNFITVIQRNIFDCCKKLKNINLSNSIYHIGKSAFKQCQSLERFTLSPSTKISHNIIIENFAFCDCIGLTKATFLSLYLHIGEESFSNCKNLKYLEIPNNATLDAHSFLNCNNLNKIIKNQFKRDFPEIVFSINFLS
ncbi:MAG: leucine-rich repeat domain-containing protein [Oscillospiraceae bacterium]|jgi:hypothetical protein|nr:leucine-rich repeat domain-containing protein [Oscillospiraceae bacterium]